jgi:hypothetical protein
MAGCMELLIMIGVLAEFWWYETQNNDFFHEHFINNCSPQPNFNNTHTSGRLTWCNKKTGSVREENPT